MKYTNYLDELVREIKSRLEEYIRLNGREIATNGSFRCLMPHNHKRGDEHYSASITKKQDGTFIWFCHSCIEGGSIFDLVHLVEGLPITGYGFIQTVIDLASRFGITVDHDQLPQIAGKNTTDIYSLHELYREIESYLHRHGNGVTHLMSGEFGRRYTKEQAEAACRLVPIGSVDAIELTKQVIAKYGVDAVEKLPFYEVDKKLLAPYLFNHNRLVLSIRDRLGRPVSFSGRVKNVFCGKDRAATQKVSKYIHAKGFEGIKKEALFLFHEAKQAITQSHEVYIVEGQFDAIAMHNAGIKNCVGILGSSFTASTIDKLIPYKVYSLVMVTDPDKAGIRAIKKALEVTRYYDVVLTAVDLPEGTDPDALLCNKDARFLENRTDALRLVLTRDSEFIDETIPPEIRYKKMIEFVVHNCGQSIKYREYAHIISGQMGYHEEDILLNLQNYANGGALVSYEEKKVTNRIIESVNLPIMEKIIIMERGLDTLKELAAGSNSVERTTWHEFLTLLNGEQLFPAILDTGLSRLDAASSIECGSLTFVSGWPSNAKSSLLQYLTIRMLTQYPDLYTLYVSTDDQWIKPLISFIGILTGIPKKTIKSHIRDKTFMNQPAVSNSLDQVHRLFNSQLRLRGLDSCSSVAAMRQNMERIRSFHKGPLMLVGDAMNNLNDIKRDDQRIAIENAIRDFKNMAVTYDAAVILVSHLTKQDGREGQRPRLKNLKGSSFIEFEAKTIFLVHMDMHSNKHTQLAWREHGVTMGENFPVVEVNVAKDKDKSAGVIVPLHFNPLIGDFHEPTEQQYRHYMKLIEEEGNAYEAFDEYTVGLGEVL